MTTPESVIPLESLERSIDVMLNEAEGTEAEDASFMVVVYVVCVRVIERMASPTNCLPKKRGSGLGIGKGGIATLMSIRKKSRR